MSHRQNGGVSAENWQRLVDLLRESNNPHEREALYFGVLAADGSPVLVDRRQLREHAHFLGTTGGGKSSLGLSPLIEQLISFGDSTVIIVDLKGDSNELLAAATHAKEHLEKRTNINLPIRYFTIDNGMPTCSFNPLASKEWNRLTPLQRADVLAAASGLIYGFDYGRGFYTAANLAMIYTADQISSGEKNFRTLREDVALLLKNTTRNELPQQLKQAGVAVFETLTRFAALEQLNLPPDSPSEINFSDCFQNPQILYFKFPSTISQITSAAVARLATYFLMAAANNTQDRCQVYLIIDEFQRMAADCLGILFEQARSLDVSLILSNQSIEDLGKHNSSLLNVIETNCNTRQWFSVGGREDVKTLEMFGCMKERVDSTFSISETEKGISQSVTYRTVLEPRITSNDLAYISNDPYLSILRLTGVRNGYSQYQGLPIVVSGKFHITEGQYKIRREFKWPELTDQMIISTEKTPDSILKEKKRQGPPSVLPIEKYPTRETQIEISDWSPEGL